MNIDLTISAPEGTELFLEPMKMNLDKDDENVTQEIPLPKKVVEGGALQVTAQGRAYRVLALRIDACFTDYLKSYEITSFILLLFGETIFNENLVFCLSLGF